jgi:hypothetical protein
MGQRQVREGDTVDNGSREDQVMKQAIADARGDVQDVEREGSVRRPLIRATLKHPEGAPPPRDPPVFTMHQQPGGNGGGAPPQAGRQGRGGPSRPFGDRRPAGGAPGNGRPSGNQAQTEGRPGSKSRSSRRGRGRSR